MVLPGAEQASYMELAQQFRLQDMKLPRGGRTVQDNDRAIRLQETMGSSKTPEEALLKRCSHFTLEGLNQDPENASQDCELIVQERQRQENDTIAEIEDNLKEAFKLKGECQEHDEHFTKWRRNLEVNAFGDLETTNLLTKMVANAQKECSIPQKGAEKIFKKTGSKRKDAPLDDELVKLRQATQKLRTLTGHLRNVVKELVSRVRALRFFQVIRAIQLWHSKAPVGCDIPQAPTCSGCKKTVQDSSAVSVLGLCGHTACDSCLASPKRNGECVVVGCDAPANDAYIQKAAELGQEDRKARVGRHYGKKLEEVIDLIKNKIPKDDQVLLFVQFDDLLKKVSAALTEHNIKHCALSEQSRPKAFKLMDDFQQNDGKDKKKVLVLDVTTVYAAGV